MTQNRLCIIGAGPAGLAMARACRLHDIAYDHFDAHSDVGGLWDIAQDGSPMYHSAHFISSKTLSGFEGFAMPASYPDYPSHKQILAYIRAFADQWHLRDSITFGTRVTDIQKNADNDWSVRTSNGQTQRYIGVVCATGSNWHPRMPEFDGTFDGDIIHSSTYKDARSFDGKRVLVVGAGNSGVDIACDAAAHADHALLSLRRGYHFFPKHIFGQPTDVFASSGPKVPLWLTRFVFGALLKIVVGDLRRFGLPQPDHKMLESHPILNTQVLHYLQHGDLHAKPDVQTLDGRTVIFKDGSRAEIDVIVCATGYHQIQPYARDYFLYENGRPNMYLQLFSREHPGLAAPSFIETNSGAFKLFDLMAYAVAAHTRDRLDGAPAAATLQQMIASDKPDLTGGINFVRSDRHAAYFDSDTWHAYAKKVFKKMGWTLPANDPRTRLNTASAQPGTGPNIPLAAE